MRNQDPGLMVFHLMELGFRFSASQFQWEKRR
jgi:hypothetical protein